ncbi:MAG: carbohydrate kinase [Actinomycetota bacterium]|nr:carbohydrate kinase [Actinomycetota bacterium]
MVACTVIGEALVDLVESSAAPGTFRAHAGGSPYNVALTLARLRQPVSLVARTGRDSFGRLLEEKARASGVGFDRWQIVDEPTTLAVASLDHAGRAQYDFYLDRTAGLGFDQSVIDVVPTGGLFHLGSIASWRAPSGPVLLALQQRVYATGDVLVSYDPNVRSGLVADLGATRAAIERCIASAHLVKASDEDVAFLYPEVAPESVAARWCRLGVSVVVLTLGAAGSAAFGAAGELSRRPSLTIEVADTVGAGDSFTGGLLAGLSDSGLSTPDALATAAAEGDGRIDDALLQAIVVAAITCERSGANPPTREELDERLQALDT